MAAAGSGDAWRISGEDRTKHDSQFFSLKPVNGFVTGEQARGFFMQSGLPTPVLGQIWGLADMNNDGKMDRKEFSIAMHLIKKKLQGYELPKSLPATLKADPSPMVGSFGAMPAQPAMMAMGIPPVAVVPPQSMAMGQRMPMMTNGMPQMVAQPTGFMGPPGAVPVSSGFSGAMPARAGVQAPPQQGAPNLGMPHPSKLKYTQIFNSHDRNKRGALTGVEARAILVQTGVPQQMLAQIWNLSDVDKDGKLDCDEFCIAMHLIDVVKMGQMLPAKLPAELLPTKARSGSFGTGPPPTQSVMPQQKDSFGELVGTMGMPAPVQPAPVANGETKQEEIDMSPVTFEDRRKQNFDKGQAELERRRQMLQDQMRKENEARLEKERKEQELRDKHRQEQERKKQQELERQLEKQRGIERQRDEQRQKMMEQREAARREMERQRQMEWERQRKEQLMAEKAREYEQLNTLKSASSNLKCELESLQGKKTEISTKISQVKNGVTDFTAHIEAMRSTRDLKNQDIERLQREIQAVNQRLSSVQSEKQSLDLKVQTTVTANPMSETHRTMMHSVELKKTSVIKLKKDLEYIEKETSNKLAEIDTQNTQLKEHADKLNGLTAEIKQAESQKQASNASEKSEKERIQREKDKHEALRKELEAQRVKEESTKSRAPDPPKPAVVDTAGGGGNWFDFGSDQASNSKTAAAASGDNWASVFDTAKQPASDSGWSAAFSSQVPTAANDTSVFKLKGPKQKYKAIYQFDARNTDELTLLPGDTVMVFSDQTGAEQGWKGGEINGKCGWFPEAYVEKMTEDSSQVEPTMAVTDIAPGGVAAGGITTSEDSSFMAVQVKMPSASPTPGQGQAAPDGLQAEALYPWKAKKDNHLTFNKGDIIHVKEQQDMWWSGEVNGRNGWFPKSYVRLIGSSGSGGAVAPSTGVTMATATAKIESPAIVEEASNSARNTPATFDRPEGDIYIGVYAYQSLEPGDLTFAVGDTIRVTQAEGDWWTGIIEDRTGIFPANYVKKSENQPSESKQGQSQTGTLKRPEIATVIASYTATGQEQLSLNPGQLIQVRKKSPSGWWEGELQARGQKRKIGWFPANYVKLLGGSARSTPDNTLNTGTASPANLPLGQSSTNPSPAPAAPTKTSTTPQPQAYVDHVFALYPYVAQHADELSFQKDAVINVIKKDDPDWWQGEYNGSTGMFPSNYVQNTTPDASSWSEDPQVLAVTSAEESKRQSHIHELINTEETYMQDMSIVLEAFYKPLIEALTEDQLQAIFVNWKDLIVCNTKLQKALRVRKKMCGVGQVITSIGDILCENIPHLTPYIRFCSCQLNAAALLQKLTETNPKFNEIHKKCVQNPKTKGMPLSSFLLKPMQRITKYPLLVEKIIKHTPETHPDHTHLLEALETCQELCSQVNEGVREKENSDRLEWIQQRVHCEGLPEKITFNSVTNCLGPRKLIHTGVVYKSKSNKELAAFLFNDFLLLTTSNRSLNNATHSVFDLTGQVQYKMYKTPVFLNEVMIRDPSTEELELFTISHIDRVYNLKCHNQLERDTWVRHLKSTSRQYLDTEKKKREKAISLRHTPGMGRLLVVILEGIDLQAKDDNGKSDPYCEVSMGAQEHKTKVINNSLNPKWNASMQFTIRDVDMDALCITVFDRDLFSPNDFLGRTEIRVKEILKETSTAQGRKPVTKKLLLHEVPTGEVVVKLDLHLFEA